MGIGLEDSDGCLVVLQDEVCEEIRGGLVGRQEIAPCGFKLPSAQKKGDSRDHNEQDDAGEYH